MIAKLEWTQSNAQQNKEQLRNPTMVLAFNNESTTTEAQQKSDNVVLRFCCPQLILQSGPIVKCKENYTFEGGGAQVLIPIALVSFQEDQTSVHPHPLWNRPWVSQKLCLFCFSNMMLESS